MHRILFISLLIFCLSAQAPVPAQPTADPDQYNILITRYREQANRDSFLLYNNLKLKTCQASDHLALWAWVQLDVSDFFSDLEGDDHNAHETLESAWTGRWRDPRDAAEWEPFCYILATNGWYLRQEGKLMQAIVALEATAVRYEQFRYHDLDAVETIYKPLGNCYTRLGDNEKALAVFFKALLVCGDNESMAGLYCDLGIAYWNMGDYDAAEKYHRQGLALPQVSGINRALLLGALAQTQLDMGQPQQAARNAQASLELLASEKPEELAQKYRCYSRRTAGIAHLRLGHFAEAGRLLSGARADAVAVFGKSSRDLGKIEIARAEWYLAQHQAAAAMEAANRALSAVLPGFQPVDAAQHPNPADFYEENVIFQALTVKAAAAQLTYEKTGDLTWLTHALTCHDLAWQAETRLRKIYQYSTSKLDLQSDARTRETSAMNVVRMLYQKTGQQMYLEKAFLIAERSKALLLSDALHDNLIRHHLADSDPRFAVLTRLQQSLSWFEKQILLDSDNNLAGQWRSEADKLVVQISVLETQINAAYPRLAEQNLATLSTVQAGLQDEEAIVEYFAGPTSIETFIFQKNKAAEWHSYAYTVALQDLAGRYLAYFDNQNAILQDPSGYLNTAFLLWQQLLPAALASSAKLTIVPDGFLNFIPFDALVTAPPDLAASLRHAAYLVRRQSVRYAWSMSVLQQQKGLPSNAGHYALCLAPGFAGGQRGLAPLASPAGERPVNSHVLISEKADLQHFTGVAGKYRVLHLSTHAFATAQDGQLPRIEMFDQPLFLPDIYALPLQADLVTLSACQTGLGHVQSGEGVMSLARAFTQAGAACVVSSLWSVNDESTSRLLAGFYRNLEAGNTIGQSLRSAKLGYLNDPEVRAAMQSPYFWAGLTMVGDDRAVAGAGVSWWKWLAASLLLLTGWFLWKKLPKPAVANPSGS